MEIQREASGVTSPIHGGAGQRAEGRGRAWSRGQGARSQHMVWLKNSEIGWMTLEWKDLRGKTDQFGANG